MCKCISLGQAIDYSTHGRVFLKSLFRQTDVENWLIELAALAFTQATVTWNCSLSKTRQSQGTSPGPFLPNTERTSLMVNPLPQPKISQNYAVVWRSSHSILPSLSLFTAVRTALWSEGFLLISFFIYPLHKNILFWCLPFGGFKQKPLMLFFSIWPNCLKKYKKTNGHQEWE